MKSVSLKDQSCVVRKSADKVRCQPIPRFAVVLAAVVTVSACGGGSSGSDSLIPGGPSGGDASGVTDDQLQKTAAMRAGAGLGLNLSNLSRLNDGAQSNLDAGSIAGSLVNSNNTEALDSLESSNNDFLNNSLGVDDPGAMTTRVKNVITIDPDDQTICSGEIPLADGFNDDLLRCQQLVTDLMVQIDARSEESGIITYLFQDAPVLLIGYSPTGASYQINLSGLQRVIQRSDELNGFTTSSESASMSGSLLLAATVLNDEPGREAGEISLEVTETLQFGSTDTEASLTLQPSTVFKLALDESTGDVSMSVNWGALKLVASSGDSEGNTSDTALNLGGLTGELSFNDDEPTFQLKNIGIGNVPLNITIDSVESVNLTLANFGITIDNDTGMVNLDGALNASLMLDNIVGILDDQTRGFTASASISAPATTGFVQQDNGSTLLSTGGPLTATLIGGDGMTSGQSEVSIAAGECFGSADDAQNSNLATAALAEIPCN